MALTSFVNEQTGNPTMTTNNRIIRIIEWDDMDKKKFFGFGAMLSFAVRTSVYPSHLIKTRLQMQHQNSLYNGTWDAFKKIIKYEGMRGLYKGFAVNLISIGSEQMYILTYELMRKRCEHLDNTPRTFIAGGFASLVSQTVRVPVDVVSQKTMMLGLAVDAKTVTKRVSFKDIVQITQQTYHNHGFFGFYRGYLASLLTFVPNSALWWTFYHNYTGQSYALGLLAVSLLILCNVINDFHLFVNERRSLKTKFALFLLRLRLYKCHKGRLWEKSTTRNQSYKKWFDDDLR